MNIENEKKYIKYLIENVDSIDHSYLDKYFRNELDFEELINSIDYTENDVKSYKNFIKSNSIDEFLR